ncbi:hypothetical protein K9E87_10975 [Staphylococcus pseudintermedius]|nr:hypothetical protein K9E87_10975 [Staphylococcus pseudintermedius]
MLKSRKERLTAAIISLIISIAFVVLDIFNIMTKESNTALILSISSLLVFWTFIVIDIYVLYKLKKRSVTDFFPSHHAFFFILIFSNVRKRKNQ